MMPPRNVPPLLEDRIKHPEDFSADTSFIMSLRASALGLGFNRTLEGSSIAARLLYTIPTILSGHLVKRVADLPE
jgi:hypothetical protein